ncbi:MAG: hypothetical protein IJG63_08260 [Oscillospiraceae bacterium]|nr:hypothetical protein [Oscillospiraceae bacterium]
MYAFFLKLLNMSAAGAVLILALILIRAVLKRAPRWMLCAMWALAAIRLVCPFSIASPVSAYSMTPELVSESGDVELFRFAGGSEKPMLAVDTLQGEAQGEGSGTIADIPGGSPAATQRSRDAFLPPLVWGWMMGLSAMLLYAGVSTLLLRRRIGAYLPLEGNVRLCDELDSPFILGVLRPRIYIPSDLSGDVRRHVLTHERAQLRRLDHLWKPLGFFILSLHWFNPLCWLGYILFCRDMELACDERVIRELGHGERAAYSQTLLNCSAHRIPAACPVAFGESGLKTRVKAALNYKKPGFWLVAAAVLACLLLVFGLASKPLPSKPATPVFPEPETALSHESDTAVSASPITVSSGGVSVEPYISLLYETKWTEAGWRISGDPDKLTPDISPEDYDKIPTVTLADDFAVRFDGYTRKSGLQIFDEHLSLLRYSWYGDTAVNWLSPGDYYGVIEAWGPQGRYIESEGAYEESIYKCVFRLIVPEGGSEAYAPEKIISLTEARLRIFDKDCVLTDADGLEKLEGWLNNAEVLQGGAGCPFGSVLTLRCADGSVYSCCPAEDSCGVLFSNGACYRYASDNEDFWELFGIQVPLNP